jgi:hypothetical protein
MKIIPSSKRHRYAARIGVFLVAATLIAGMVGAYGAGSGYTLAQSQNLEIQDWYDLDAVRDNLSGNHTLMNDLDSTTAGYEELASPTANQGEGWDPIGFYGSAPSSGCGPTPEMLQWFGLTGTFDGQGHEIHDLFINRPGEDYVGLFGSVDEGGIIKDVGVVNATVTGGWMVGGLVGWNEYTVSNSYSSGNVNGGAVVGGLMGANDGTVSDSYSSGNVTGEDGVGGLVGDNYGTVSNSYSTGSVYGSDYVGGLVGDNAGDVNNSFWDTETSGQATSDGGAGKNTTEMQDIATFSGAGWNITAVAPGSTNTTFTWNIVDGETYPFLGSTKSTSQNQQPQEDNFVISLTDSGEIVLSEHEIQAYHNDDNAFILNENGIKKWNSFLTYQTVSKLADSLFSREFVLKIEGQEICKGEFWSYASSTFYSGVVILDSLFKLDTEHNTLWIKSFSMNSNTSLDAAISSELISFFERRNLQK